MTVGETMRHRLMIAVYILLLLPFSLRQACADDRFDAMLIDESDAVSGFLMGTIKGFLWANIALNQQGKDMLYCQPNDLDSSLELARQAATLGREELREEDRVAENLTIAIYLGLQKMFPCETSRAN